MNNKIYDKEFYKEQKDGSSLSASIIVPYILDILSSLHINSVVDFGCGTGSWLAQFKLINNEIEIKGLDFGCPDSSQFYIDSKSEFLCVDLSEKIDLGRSYDMAISLECAEHIKEEYAYTFIDNLCNHSDIILFGAAIPGQGGRTYK